MASKAPLLLLAGAAALLMMGKKKKATGNGKITPSGLPVSDHLRFDEACEKLLQRLNVPGYDNRMTNKYVELRKIGVDDPVELTLEILKMDAGHCPWDNPGDYTDQMKLTFDAQLAAVQNFYELEQAGELDLG
jgi:hypothetical protein